MKLKDKNREHFIFALIRECLPHDDGSSQEMEPLSGRAFYWSLAIATVVAGVLGWIRYGMPE